LSAGITRIRATRGPSRRLVRLIPQTQRLAVLSWPRSIARAANNPCREPLVPTGRGRGRSPMENLKGNGVAHCPRGGLGVLGPKALRLAVSRPNFAKRHGRLCRAAGKRKNGLIDARPLCRFRNFEIRRYGRDQEGVPETCQEISSRSEQGAEGQGEICGD